MATATSTFEQIKNIEQGTTSNPLANLWLGLMSACLGGTLLCTVALVAWPLIATKLTG